MPNAQPIQPFFQKLLAALVVLCLVQVQASAQQDAELPLDLSNPPQQWQALFDTLGAHPRIESQFTERRYFPFRKFPKRLRGTMHFDESRGIALHYQSPGNYIVFALPDGIFIRNEDESNPSEIPSHASAAVMLQIMPDLMRFAPQKLAERFSASGQMLASGDWQITLSRLSPQHVPGLQQIRLSGDGQQLKTLELVRGVHERSEIDIGLTQFPAADATATVPWPAAKSPTQQVQ